MESPIARKIKAFFESYPTRTYTKGEILIHAEEDPPGVLYMESGRVSQYDITSKGNEVVVNVFKAGAFFPMSSAMNNTPNHYFFEASSPVRVRIAPPEDAVRFLKENPDILYDLLARVYRGVDGVLRRMAHLMGGDAKSRLLFEILNAAYRFGELQSDGSIFVALKEGDLARHSGLARETVNRTMQDLKTSGVLAVDRNGLTIQDTRQLEAMLGEQL